MEYHDGIMIHTFVLVYVQDEVGVKDRNDLVDFT